MSTDTITLELTQLEASTLKKLIELQCEQLIVIINERRDTKTDFDEVIGIMGAAVKHVYDTLIKMGV